MEPTNDQPTTGERDAIFVPPLQKGTVLPPPASRGEQRRSEDFVRATLNLLDRNNDGYLSTQEARQFHNIDEQAAQRIIAALQQINAHNAGAGGIPSLTTPLDHR